ncbi:MAG TPA: helix-hairpin-helix domain-containing protein [Gemmatimonadaceae bacterium]|nr:helix-hairpin-helix domain-containing protein [Gemmatimonadaceae bacterium]
MPTKAERTALVFLGAVVLAGGTVRLFRAARQGAKPPAAAAAALDAQRHAVDSAFADRAESRAGRRPSRGARRGDVGRGVTRTPEPVAPSTFVPLPPQSPAPVDIDRASAAELEALPRIGPALAARIVAERDANGVFGSFDALDARVKGIGPAIIKLLQGKATFSSR